ncbi:FAD-dependent oxidoreductase [Candidatus Nomurabacteria bacterium]|nr:FAD-dependent oxidoreductase [Candidatus Nomurabacteria bacterium]
MEKNIIIVGGGFGGIQSAISLARKKIKNVKITLISNKDYFQYYPGFYRIVTGASPIEVAIPLSDILPKEVNLVIKSVNDINLVEKKISCEDNYSFYYDTLVLALGSETTYFNLPGIEELSFGFKSVDEALKLKKHLVSLFEDFKDFDKNDSTSHFHFIIVGGGPSGVEVAGDLSYFLPKLAKEYKIDPSWITIDLIDSNSRILPTLPEKVSTRILARLRKLGINIFLNRTMEKEELEQVFIKGMSIKAKTVIWTAGTQLNKLIPKISGLQFSARKRVEVNEYLEAKGSDKIFADVFIVGDIANTPYAGLAQTAIHNARFVSKVISMRSKNKKIKIYKPEKVAFSIPVGVDWGVFSMGNINFYGFFAYFVRHAIDFVFFFQVLSFVKFIGLFIKGWKYRKIKLK